MEEDFKKRYEKYTDEQIIQVLVSPDNYQKAAVQVAEKEALSRNISLDNLNILDRQLLKRSVEPNDRIITEAWKNKVKSISFHKVNELYSDGNAVDRSVILIVTIFILLIISIVFHAFLSLMNISFFEPFSIYDGVIPSVLEIVSILFMIFLIWNRKGIGWYIASTYSVFIFTMNADLFVQSCKYFYYESDDFSYQNGTIIFNENESDLLNLIRLFEPNPPLYYVPSLIIVGILLYLFFKKETVVGFGFTAKDILKVGSIGIVLFGMFRLFIHFY